MTVSEKTAFSSSSLKCSNKHSISYSVTPAKIKYFAWKKWKSTPSIVMTVLVILTVFCDISPTVSPAPLPSSSAWSLPTLNYLFKDTKTRSQSDQYRKEQHEISHGAGGTGGGSGGGGAAHHHHYKTLPGDGSGGNEGGSSSQSASLSSSSSAGASQMDKGKNEGKVSSTGRLISVHDIRLTDNWGWVRRGVSDPSQTTEQRRKQNKNNIRHSKSKHKQRHFSALSSSTKSKRKKENSEKLLCPFDEIRGPDGKCRKAPRFSLYRVG